MITVSKLPFFNRYDLPRVFRGERDWRKFVIYPAEYYLDNRIALRRATQVVGVDGTSRTLTLAHNETLPLRHAAGRLRRRRLHAGGTGRISGR